MSLGAFAHAPCFGNPIQFAVDHDRWVYRNSVANRWRDPAFDTEIWLSSVYGAELPLKHECACVRPELETRQKHVRS